MNRLNTISIYDFLREAEGDDTSNDAGGAEANAPTDANAGEDNTADDTVTNDAGGDDQDDDEFNMDASLDDEGGEDGDTGTDDSADDLGSDSGSDDTGSPGGDEEAVDSNTSIFDSLTAEEQQIKIKELKDQYKELYSSTDDLIDRLSNFCVDENNYHVINRIIDALRKIREYLEDYFIYTFPTKSYIENDIMYNEFLYIISRISSTLEKFSKKVEEVDNE